MGETSSVSWYHVCIFLGLLLAKSPSLGIGPLNLYPFLGWNITPTVDGEFVAVDHRLVDCFGMVAHIFEIYKQFSFFRESTQPVSIVLGSLRTCVVNETLKTAVGALMASQPQAKLARGPFVSVAVSAPEHGWNKWLLMGKEDERTSWHQNFQSSYWLSLDLSSWLKVWTSPFHIFHGKADQLEIDVMA